MEQRIVTDDLLKEVLPKVRNELVEEWEKEPVEDHTFSARFNRKMKTFIWKHKNKQLIKELKIVGKIAAALLIVVGICFFGNTMVSRANLDVLFKKIEVALEDSAMYIYDKDTDSYYFTAYEPGYIPEGYVEVSRVVDNDYVSIRYTNKEEKNIIWNQLLVRNNMVMGMDAEYDDVVIKEYAGENVNIYVYESGAKRLYYEYGNYIFTMNVTSISVEDMYQMIKEMKEIEK